MGLLHAGILNFLPNVNLISISEKEGMLGGYIKNAFPQTTVYSDYEKMMSSEKLDLVYITTPILSHLPIALSCIEHGINFFMEKPLARNLEECKKLCTSLKNSDIIHGVGFNRRFIDTFQYAKKLLDNNILDEIISVNSNMYMSNIFSKSSGWRLKKEQSGGGVLLDFGSHLIDLLLWYFGPINKTSGKITSVYSKEVEDEANMEIKFENGINGTLDTSWSKKGYRLAEINLEIIGKNGTMNVTEDLIKISLNELVQNFENKKSIIYKQSLNQGVIIDIGGPEFTKEDVHMIECVNTKKLPLVDVFEASRTQSVIDAMYKSATKKQTEIVEYVK